MEKIDHVAIAGAGVGGLALALGLHHAGIRVSVFEKYSTPQKHNTGFTLWSYSVRRLANFGFGPDQMEEVGASIEYTEIRNQGGRIISKMPVGEVSRSLGSESYEVRRADLLQKIEDQLPEGTVRRGLACTHAETENDRAFLELENADRIEADLVIGADGIHSALREIIAGPTPLHESGYLGCSALCEIPETALPKNTHIDIWGRGGKAGISEVSPGLARWYLTWKAKKDAERQTKTQLLAAYADWGDLITQAIEATVEADIVHHTYADISAIPTWHRGRVALLGDAAHATTPFAAMGANMAIEDASVLVEALTENHRVSDALSIFEDSRKKRTEDVVIKGRRMSRLTQLHSPFAAWLRDQAFLHMPAEDTERVTREMASGEG